MDITDEIQKIEAQLEQYEDCHEPEEKMDLKQSIKASIKAVRGQAQNLPVDLKKAVTAQLDDFEEILTY